MRDFSKIIVSLCLVFISTSVWAQDKKTSMPDEKVEKKSAEKKPELTKKSKEASLKEKKPDAKKEAEAEDKKEAKTKETLPKPETLLGPGGKPLRMDYPGTDASKVSSMATGQVEGVDTKTKTPTTAYGLRVRELETKIDDLKERVFQSKTRIVLLREKLLSGNLAGSKVIIVHKTELGSAWRLSQAIYNLDGARVFSQIDEEGTLSDKEKFEVYNGGLAPGNHKITVFLKYQGTSVGIFPYFKGYSGEIRSVCDIVAKEGKLTRVEVVIYPEGGITESIEKRPNFRCEAVYFENVVENQDNSSAKKTSSDTKAATK